MADRPFGFGPPGGGRPGSGSPGSGSGSGSSGGPPDETGGAGPLGPLGDPQQFADALRQFADLMSWQGGPVNWDLAKNVARHAVAAGAARGGFAVAGRKSGAGFGSGKRWLAG